MTSGDSQTKQENNNRMDMRRNNHQFYTGALCPPHIDTSNVVNRSN